MSRHEKMATQMSSSFAILLTPPRPAIQFADEADVVPLRQEVAQQRSEMRAVAVVCRCRKSGAAERLPRSARRLSTLYVCLVIRDAVHNAPCPSPRVLFVVPARPQRAEDIAPPRDDHHHDYYSPTKDRRAKHDAALRTAVNDASEASECR